MSENEMSENEMLVIAKEPSVNGIISSSFCEERLFNISDIDYAKRLCSSVNSYNEFSSVAKKENKRPYKIYRIKILFEECVEDDL